MERRTRKAATNGTTSQPSRPRSLTRACPGGRGGPNGKLAARPNHRAPGHAHLREHALGMRSASAAEKNNDGGALHPTKHADGNTECSLCQVANPSPNGAREATWREHRRHKFKHAHATRAGVACLLSTWQGRVSPPCWARPPTARSKKTNTQQRKQRTAKATTKHTLKAKPPPRALARPNGSSAKRRRTFPPGPAQRHAPPCSAQPASARQTNSIKGPT